MAPASDSQPLYRLLSLSTSCGGGGDWEISPEAARGAAERWCGSAQQEEHTPYSKTL